MLLAQGVGLQGGSCGSQFVEVAGRCGPSGDADGAQGAACVLEQVLAPGFLATSAVCSLGLAAILQNRLPGHLYVARGTRRVADGIGFEEGPALFDPVCSRATATKKRALDALLTAVFAQARAAGLIESKPEGAVDATGLQSGYASAHYLNRRAESGDFVQKHWPKLTLVCHNATYLIAGAVASRGPSNDATFLPPAMLQATEHIHFDRLLADKAYDAEYIHELCREKLGIRSTIIPLNPRRFRRQLPKTKYRRQLFVRFPNRLYGRRWHVESAISQNKRILGSALRARNESAQHRECYLRVLTHNLMRLRSFQKLGFQQSTLCSE